MKRALLVVALSFSAMLSEAQKKVRPASSMLTGKQIYTKHCMTCHQVDGSGAQNMIPPLINTDYVLGTKARLISIVLNGMKGEIKVNGDRYSNEMPSQAFLKDDEIAAVLTYVRKSFGNKATAVTKDEVKKMRAASQKAAQSEAQ
jgi:mono/diheme cytochrome c family protein